jgi:predicted nucleotidyltransferase
MNKILGNLKLIHKHLTDLKVEFALVGGLAVSARSNPRFTQDIDLAVSILDDKAAEMLVNKLSTTGYQILAIVEQEATKRLATVRLLSTKAELQGVVVDMMFASSGIEPEIVEQADVLSIVEGFSLPIACLGHLIALKILARDDKLRPQDLQDLQALFASASRQDLQMALDALQLIANRGYHRNRDLVALFEKAKEQFVANKKDLKG